MSSIPPNYIAIITFALCLFIPSIAQTTKIEETCDEKVQRLKKEGYYDFGARSNYFKSQNETFGDAVFRIVGNGWCADETIPDVIRGTITFHNMGDKLIQPEALLMKISTTSLDRAKHPDGETLTILTDGKVLLSRPLKLRDDWTTRWTMKHFDFGYFTYSDFLKIVQADKVIFQIGQTKAELQEKELQSIRKLNNLIQKPDEGDAIPEID